MRVVILAAANGYCSGGNERRSELGQEKSCEEGAREWATVAQHTQNEDRENVGPQIQTACGDVI